MKICGIEFAPLWIPLERRLQTASVLFYCFSFVFLPAFGPIICITLLFTPCYFLSLLYISWIIYDRHTCNRGGRPLEWYRSLKMWVHMRDYFPVQLIKTCDLPADKNYMMVYHPHGILCAGGASCFGSEAANFKGVFPGLTSRVLVWAGNFWIPFHREQTLSLGLCSASKDSIEWLLTKNGTGNALVLVVGGAQESMEAHPGSATLYLNRRKGFIKLALKHGVPLVPVFAFGENDVFKQLSNPPGSFLRKLQNKYIETIGFAPIFLYGRGIFQYSFGLLPFRRPITVVVGSPIHLEKVKEPTREEINLTHQKYVESLKELFEQHKGKYGPNLQLQII